MRRSLLRATAAAGATVAVVATIGAVSVHANAATGSTALPGTTPRWLPKATSEATPNATKEAAQSVRVYLAPKGGAANLAKAVTEISTPGSATYRHYLTPTQYFAAYAPTAASLKSVKSWLTGDGLSITDADSHNRWVDASGDEASLNKAFGVTLKSYAHDGQHVVAPNGPTYVPNSLASTVAAVDGLDTTVVTATTYESGEQAALTGTTSTTSTTSTAATAPAATGPAAFRNARPCSLYYGQVAAKYQADYSTGLPRFQGSTLPYAVCGYTGPQFRAAYEGATSSSLDGAGVTVGIIDAYASPFIASDAATYASNHGDGSYAAGQLTQTTDTPFTHGTACAGQSGWWGEETLDVEAVHAMAPGANIHYYGAQSCYDKDLRTIQQQLVDDDSVDIVSNSYGEPDEATSAASAVADSAVFQQGAMEGISFTFSSGDDGDEVANTGVKQSDSSASNPYVTAVGGTATGIDANGNLSFSTGWGTDKYSLSTGGKAWNSVGYLYGAGGGYSTLYNEPSYQVGVVPSTAPQGRAVPDVAMDADPTTGMLIGITQKNPDGKQAYGEYRIGGTSLASPLFAGFTALKIEKAKGKLGFLNPAIYGAKASFNDVNGPGPDAGNVRVDYVNGFDPSDGYAYSVRTFNQDASLTTAKGWDDVTGLGVPKTTWVTKTTAAS